MLLMIVVFMLYKSDVDYTDKLFDFDAHAEMFDHSSEDNCDDEGIIVSLITGIKNRYEDI